MNGRLIAVAGLLASAAVAAPAQAASTVTFNWVGDTVLGSRYGLPPNHGRDVFRAVSAQLQDADITIGNLEGTFSQGGPSKCGRAARPNCFAFQAPPSYADALPRAGFDLMNLANNHAHDFGDQGLRQTIQALDRVHVAHTGLRGATTRVTVRDVRIAFVGFAPYPWANSLTDIDGARRIVARAARDADLVVVAMHAGAEGAGKIHTPHGRETAFGEDRGMTRRFAHAGGERGADLL